MKFLVETEIFANAPVDRFNDLVTMQLNRRAKGYGEGLEQIKVECAYGVLGKRGSFFIVEAPDAETLQKLLVFAPLFHFEKMTVTPLVDLSVSLRLMGESADRISQALEGGQ
jgi:muconolactone delta-isomerase